LAALPPRPAPGFEKRSFAALHDHLASVSDLFRYSELARDLLFQPSFNAVAARWVKACMPQTEDQDSDLADTVLDMKIRPYYSGPAAGPDHGGRRTLEPLAEAVKAGGGRTYVFLTPQNLARVSDFLDRPSFEANRAALKAPFTRAGLAYQDLATWAPPGKFLDHCHLDPEGNQALALRIFRGLQ
jgi:hypothetical protein